MKGIDVYHNESKNETSALKTIPEKAYKESDFCIVKATQGTAYAYTKFFHAMIKRVLNDGKLAGAYHYAAGNDAKKEADYFIKTVKPYLGKIILCLDWESIQNKAWGSKTWCATFINRVKAQTGITCFLYTGLDGMKQNANLAGNVPLWFAGYPTNKDGWEVPKFKYNLGSWKAYAIWQYTSSGEKIDRNTSPLTAVQWKEYCAGKTLSARCLELLKEYHEYIKKHSALFINRYDSSIDTFEKAKAKIEKKEKVGITCVVPLRWALDAMAVRNAAGKALISAPGGSFTTYYTGQMKECLTRITTGNAIGKTIKQAVDSKLLKPGDIICFKNLTHTFIYSGTGYKMYEGGSAAAKDGYKNGILLDYSKDYHAKKQIAEILRWKSSAVTTKKKETKKVSKPKTAAALIAQANAWKGCKESDGSHKKIIDVYNSHTPRARGYKVTYKDAWCATFVSACAIATGMTDIIPLECSCNEMIALAKEKGIWIENENRTPSPGDILFYDWQDTGKGDDKGTSEHVGIVKEVKSGKITVIEGNYKDAVGERTIAVNGRYIRGYMVPKYDKAKDTTPKKTTKPTIEQAAANVIDGKYGNGDARQKALKNLGFTTAEITKIQTLVNQKLKASNKSTKPTIDQAVKNVIDGKYGNGEARTKALTKLGFTAAERKKIQNLVNKKLK